jgi:hypothetical protein
LIAFSMPRRRQGEEHLVRGRRAGSRPASRRARRISGRERGWTYWSCVACSVIASIDRRSPWPMLHRHQAGC